MRPVYFLIFIALTCNLSAQSFELTEDRGFSNRYTNVLNVGDSLWVVGGFYQQGSIGDSETYIKAFNQSGEEVWNFDATFSQGRIIDIILNAEQELVVSGGYQMPCDLITGHPLFILRFNLEGELISEHIHELDIGPFDQSEVITLPSGEMVFASDVVGPFGDFSNSLFAFNSTGEQLLWESDWEDQSIDNITNINESVVLFCENQLYEVDGVGNPVDSLPYGSAPKDVCKFQESNVLLLWEDSVYILNETLELEPAFSVEDEFESATRLFFDDQSIYVWFNSVLKEFTSDFEFVESTQFENLPYFNLAELQLSDSVLCLVGNKSFDEIPVSNGGFYKSGAMVLYSTSESTQEFNADVAIRHLELESFTGVQVNQDPPLFHFYGEVSGYVVNTGDEITDSVNLNFFGDQGICGVESQRLQLSDINLLPGDSMPFTMGELQYLFVHLSDSAGSIDFCVFASVPSGLYDRDETNDTGCATGDFGVGIHERPVGITSTYPNPASEHITMEFPESKASDILQVFDATGKELKAYSINGQSRLTLNVADWNKGLYFLRIVSEGVVSEPVKVSIAH